MRRLMICIFALLLTVACGWLSYATYNLWRDPNTLPIERVQVEGTFRYVSRSVIEQEMLPFVQHGFLHVDVAILQKKLLEHKAVKEARVVRVWPNKLWIDVIEHHFVARWSDTNTQQMRLVNDEGSLIEIAPTAADQALPILTGPATQIKSLLQMMQQIDHQLATINLSIDELKLDQRHALQAKLNNNIWLFLGRDTTLERVSRFVQVYEKLIPIISGKVNYIDLRYTNGIAVKIDK